MKQLKSIEEFKVGIALSGGAARGIAHIGVLKALEENGIYPEVVSGTSMGAIVGLFYTAGFSPDEMHSILREEKFYKILGLNLKGAGLFNLKPLKEIFEDKIKENNFSVLKKKFFVAVSNLNTARVEVISKGPNLFEYVIASASIPFVFPAQHINDQTYIDGGLFNNLPAECLLGRCDRIIGVNVNHNGIVDEVKGARAIAERSFSLALEQNVKLSRNYCDFYIEPRKLRNFSSWEYDKVDELVEIGYNKAKKSIEQFIVPELQSH